MKKTMINTLLHALKHNPNYDLGINYHIPALWDSFNNPKAKRCFNNERIVNPYQHLAFTIEELIKLSKHPLTNDINQKKKEWIKESSVYSIHLRSLMSFDSDNSGTIETSNSEGFNESGTFLKCIYLLPHLKYIGVDTLYFIPFFKTSSMNKKGNAGSSYSVTNYFEIDDVLYDPLVSELSLLQQAQAFFELVHALGFKTVIDIIPRTSALDSSLVIEHPQWFYWIKSECQPFFIPPCAYIGIKNAPATVENMELVYTNEETMGDYIAQFSLDPASLDTNVYKKCVKQANNDPVVFLDLIKEYFNIQLAPAFSDCLNDAQAPWSDVTYLRLYNDLPPLAAKYYPSDVPYIFYDSAKASLNPGNQPNKPLWEILSNIVPFWQKNLGIDGVRIDMGHALPKELLIQIQQKAKIIDPNIVFIAEELDNNNHKRAKENGYDLISGNGFSELYHIEDGKNRAFYYQTSSLDLPIFALAESHDSPRLASRNGGKELARMVTCMNLFTPNAIPFINNGQEWYELAPLNIGIDATSKDQFALDKNDPRYGLLGLFDFTWMNWKDSNLIHDLHNLFPIRQLISESLFDVDSNYPLFFSHPDIYAYGACFKVNQLNNEYIIALANCNRKACDLFVSLAPLCDVTGSTVESLKLIYSTDASMTITSVNQKDFTIESDAYTFMLFKLSTK